MKKRLFSIIKIIAILVITLLLFHHPKESQAYSYYTENFDDGDSDGWEVSYSGSCNGEEWFIDSGKYTMEIYSKYFCVAESIWKIIEIPINSYYTYEFDMNFTDSINMDRNFYIKYVDQKHWYGFHIIGNNIHLEKVYEEAGNTDIFLVKTFPFIENNTYHIKSVVRDENISLFITNPQNETVEFSYQDIPPILNNKYVGLRASTGAIPTSKVWFDNIKLKIYENYNNDKFNLPFQYPGRDSPTISDFNSAFWNSLTAVFDHSKLGNVLVTFNNKTFNKKDCPKGVFGLSCYDSHNGTDFAPKYSDKNVYPVADGLIVYSSIYNNKCVPDKSGFGCVVIIYHPVSDIYTLYAHLSEIYVHTNDNVRYSDPIGIIGNTGCGPKCGIHIHLGVLKDKTLLSSKNKMTEIEWENLLIQIEPKNSSVINSPPKHYCSYKTPNNNVLYFLDPSGWNDPVTDDPWSLSLKTGNCNTSSSYMWIYNIL